MNAVERLRTYTVDNWSICCGASAWPYHRPEGTAPGHRRPYSRLYRQGLTFPGPFPVDLAPRASGYGQRVSALRQGRSP